MTGHPHVSTEAACRPSLRGRLVGPCLECGGPLPVAAQKGQEFCCTACRKAFNNRRAVRGAELHDLFMAHRFARDEATELGVLQAMNRMASNWREEDRRHRDSRRSWRRPAAVLAERPFLKAQAVKVRVGR